MHRNPARPSRLPPLIACLASLVPTLCAQEAPKVAARSPAHLAFEADAKQVKQLTITFDRPMSQAGWSLCGGGPTFPAIKGRPAWKNAETLVIEVDLEVDHEYEIGLNCAGATNFRSAEGIPLVPIPWVFGTLPEKLPNAAEQRTRNQKALDTLVKTLAAHYSYYDLRVHDWDKLIGEHAPDLLAAKTDKSWAATAAKMLAPTQDIHMSVRVGSRTFPTGTRSVDPLFREKVLGRYVPVTSATKLTLQGKTEDGIGYLMIGGWTNALDIAALEKIIGELRDAKALVIDVRPNSGGDEILAQRAAAWFVEGTRAYAKNRYRVGSGKAGFGPVIERKVTGNKDPAMHYKGPIAVLTSAYVMSSNESFVLMMKQAKDCTVIGQRTFGSSGNPKDFQLPNGVTVAIPSWQDLRLDGTCFEGEGLAPDVEVAATPADWDAERDPILEKALQVLRDKLKR